MTVSKPLTVITVMALVPSAPMTSLAVSRISSVSLKISSEIGAGNNGNDVEVTTSSSEYDVPDMEMANESDGKWGDGDKPKLKVTLAADGDYTFAPGFSKGDVSLSSNDGKVTSVSRSSDELVVYITLDVLDRGGGDYGLDISGLEWSKYGGVADWDEAEDTKRYEVRPYRGNSVVTSILTTPDISYDFSSYITRSSSYTFEVQGVYSAPYKGSWEGLDSRYVPSNEVEEISAGGSLDSPPDTGDGAQLKDDVGW